MVYVLGFRNIYYISVVVVGCVFFVIFVFDWKLIKKLGVVKKKKDEEVVVLSDGIFVSIDIVKV